MQESTISSTVGTARARRALPIPVWRTAARKSYSELTPEAVMGLVADGDVEALGELYDRFGKLAYGLALRVARDPGLAEDAVQDAFISVWRSAPSFDARRGAPRSWIATLTHRRAVDLVDRAARRPEDPSDILPESGGPSTAERAAERAEQNRVREALASLPIAQRQALELSYYGGYSQSEIAARLAVPVGTIKSRVFTGLARLRHLLAADD